MMDKLQLGNEILWCSMKLLWGSRESLGTSSVLERGGEVPGPCSWAAPGLTQHFVYPQGLSPGVQTDYLGLA